MEKDEMTMEEKKKEKKEGRMMEEKEREVMVLEVPDESLYLTTDIRKGQLPRFLEKAVSVADITEQKDMLLISALTAVSYALPHLRILHGRPQHEYSPNLISLIIAPPASGKGVMNNAERLLDPINEYLKKSGKNAIYSGDFSSSSFVRTLAENEGEIFMIQTEMDKMGKNWKQSSNDFSDMFRQAFEHETIRYTRSSGTRDTVQIEIKHPEISALLSGTLDQLKPLVGDGQNGLASRFLPYIVEGKVGFDPGVLGHGERYEKNGVHAVYAKLGKELLRRWKWMSGLKKDVLWSLTSEQSVILGQIFSDAYNLAFEGLEMPEVFDATVKRMLVIILRIGAVLTALRIDVHTPSPLRGTPPTLGGESQEVLYCGEEDFRTLVMLSEKLLRHAGLMVLMLTEEKAVTKMRTIRSDAAERMDELYSLLPGRFTYDKVKVLCGELGIVERTMKRYLNDLVEAKKIVRLSKGNYKKP